MLLRIRALSPVPGLALEIRGVDLFVVEAAVARSFPRALVPGEAAITPDGVVVRTGDGRASNLRAHLIDDDADAPLLLGAADLAARIREVGRSDS